MTSLVAIQGLYFSRFHYFAVAFVTVGTPVGRFVFAKAFLLLSTQYTWRGSMLITAAIALQLCVCGALMKHPEEPATMHDENKWQQEKWTVPFKKPIFWLFPPIYAFLCGSLYIYLSMLNALMVSRGMGQSTSASVLSLSGLAGLVANVLSPFIAQSPRLNRTLLLSVAYLLVGTAAIFTASCTDKLTFGIAAGTLRFGAALSLSMLLPAAIELFGADHLPIIHATTAFSAGIGGLLLLPLAGRPTAYR